MKTVIVAMVIAMAAACSPPEADFTPIEGQDRFVNVAWREFYQRTDAAPDIEWVKGDALNCHDHTGWLDKKDGCLAGRFIRDSVSGPFGYDVQWIKLSLPGGYPVWDDMCHEMIHAINSRDGHPSDDHPDADFGPGGRSSQCAFAVAVAMAGAAQ